MGRTTRWTAERRLVAIAIGLLVLDQFTKWLIWRRLPLGAEQLVLPGFFRLVHWGNTGAAWSLFHGSNRFLAIVSAVALVVLYLARWQFGAETRWGQVALGLIFGGIAGNLVDRLVHRHVVDFLYFHVVRRDGVEMGFPAFNVADAAICTGVGIVLLLSWTTPPAGSAPGAGKSLTPAGACDQSSSSAI